VPGNDDDDLEEQVRDYKDSLVQGLAPSAIAAWIEKVVDTAIRLCNGSAIRYERDDDGGYLGEIVAPTNEDAKCLARAIDLHAPASPELVRDVLMVYRAKLLPL
jgi:hypothetical protein